MKQFRADRFILLINYLGKGELFLERIAKKPGRRGELAASLRSKMRSHVEEIEKYCIELGLDLSAVLADRIKIETSKRDAKALQSRYRELGDRIHDELKTGLFLQIPKEKASYYSDASHLFGSDALAKFPSVVSEVEEAGKCYAASRNTGCVFHLMRVMEAALKTIAAQLGVPIDANRNWGSLLNALSAAIKAKHPSDDWTEFYNGLVARLHAVKDAWRNPTMHTELSYNEVEARDIYNSVSSFMRHLCTRLRE